VRLAVISDIHGNLEALQSVLEHISARQVDRIICLGDIVGYGANPAECLRLVQDTAHASVLGNHDAAVLSETRRSFFNPYALQALLWTTEQLSDDDKAWIETLPYRFSRDDILFVHAAPRVPEQWEYVFSGMEARRYGRYFHERICFIGHSHVPGVYPVDPGISGFDSVSRYLINVGSVGQPRDGDRRACYGLLDTVSGSFEHQRVEYDIAAAMKKILLAGLPKRLAQRLLDGT
jgi:diadenosine tetraphosphatase ApaH/serine/threonine PP2A family protein phosphatase